MRRFWVWHYSYKRPKHSRILSNCIIWCQTHKKSNNIGRIMWSTQFFLSSQNLFCQPPYYSVWKRSYLIIIGSFSIWHKVYLWRCHTLMVADGFFSHKIGYVANPEGHPNRINCSKVTAILLNVMILPIGGLFSSRIWKKLGFYQKNIFF